MTESFPPTDDLSPALGGSRATAEEPAPEPESAAAPSGPAASAAFEELFGAEGREVFEALGALGALAGLGGLFGQAVETLETQLPQAIAAFTHTLAVEYCKEGVRVNAIAPGSVTSGITNNVEFPDDLTKDEGKLVRRIMSPTGFGDPADVASVVALLASDDGRHMTGEIVRIDGGTHA